MTTTVEQFVRIAPDHNQALAFFAALYPSSCGGNVHFRGVAEPADGRNQQNLHYALDERFSENVESLLDWCAVEQRAAFFLPGIVKGTGTGKADVHSLPAILIDFDKGDPDAGLANVEALIGPATIIVESGGRTESGPKLHAYWRLAEPATLAEVDTVCRLREALAQRFGGDPAFKQPAQVIRVPGSIHFKGTPKLVQLRTIRPEAVYSLGTIAASVSDLSPNAANSNNPFSAANYRPSAPDAVERALTQPVHEGGVDDITRFEAAGKVIGHNIRMVREGRMSPDEAWEATVQWNAANMVPPWPEERLRKDFDRLVRNDVEARGPLALPQSPIIAGGASDWSLDDWSIDRFRGEAPERKWLVEGLIPQGTAGVFAAAGDAGKSMMALWLAYVIGCYPDPTGIAPEFTSPKFFGQPIMRRGAAVVLTAEDDEAEVHRRIEKLDPSRLRNNGKQRVYVVPMPSAGGVRAIMEETPAGARPTEFWANLLAKLVAIPDLALIVVDPLSAFVDADVERNNRTGAHLMAMLSGLAQRTGATVMLTHHVSKGAEPTGLSDARGAIRGASALVDNGRWALTMWEADTDTAYAKLKTLGQPGRARQAGVVYLGGLAKGNAPGAKLLRTLVRNAETGLLEDVTEAVRAATPGQGELDETVIAALRAQKALDPRFSFGSSKNSLAEAWKAAFRGDAPRMNHEAREDQFWRLLSHGGIAKTDQMRGGYPVYEPAF